MGSSRTAIDGSGISTLTSDAGLTTGAFYAHFAPTDDLVANVVADESRTQLTRYGTLRPGRPGLGDLIRPYLPPGTGPTPASCGTEDCRQQNEPTRHRAGGSADAPVVEGDDPTPGGDAVDDPGVPVVQDRGEVRDEDHRRTRVGTELAIGIGHSSGGGSPQWEAAAGQALAHLLADSERRPVRVPNGLIAEVFQRALDALLPAAPPERRAVLAGPGRAGPGRAGPGRAGAACPCCGRGHPARTGSSADGSEVDPCRVRRIGLPGALAVRGVAVDGASSAEPARPLLGPHTPRRSPGRPAPLTPPSPVSGRPGNVPAHPGPAAGRAPPVAAHDSRQPHAAPVGRPRLASGRAFPAGAPSPTARTGCSERLVTRSAGFDRLARKLLRARSVIPE